MSEPACATYLERWRLDRLQGVERSYLDSTPAREHIDLLVGHGWTLRGIAGAARIAPDTVCAIQGGRAMSQRSTVAAILALGTDTLPERAYQATEPLVPRVGTVRRIQALLFMGWPHRVLRAHSGVHTAPLLHQSGRWVTRTTHDRVVALYDDLAMRAGPSDRSRLSARRYGYVGPLAWDDIDHDEAPNLDGREEAS